MWLKSRPFHSLDTEAVARLLIELGVCEWPQIARLQVVHTSLKKAIRYACDVQAEAEEHIFQAYAWDLYTDHLSACFEHLFPYGGGANRYEWHRELASRGLGPDPDESIASDNASRSPIPLDRCGDSE